MDLTKRKVFLILLGACGAVLILMASLVDFSSQHQVFLVAANFHNSSLSYLTALNLSVNILSNKRQELKSSLVKGSRKNFQNSDGNPEIIDENVTENDLRYVKVNNKSSATNKSETGKGSNALETDFIQRKSKRFGGNFKMREPFSQNNQVSSNTNESARITKRKSRVSNSVMLSNYGYMRRYRSKPTVVQENYMPEHDNSAASDDVTENIHNNPGTLFDATKTEGQDGVLNYQKTLKKTDILNYINAAEINEEVRFKGDKVNKNNDVNLPAEVNGIEVKNGGIDRLRNSQKTFQSTDDSTETIIKLQNQYNGEHKSSIEAVENHNALSQSIYVDSKVNQKPLYTFQYNSGLNSSKNKTSYLERTYDNGQMYTTEGFIQDSTCSSRYTGVEDILCMKRPNFLPDFRNPCWYQRSTLKCLPYFQIIGVCKTGTTDLFERLSHHPQIIKNNGILGKETWYWTWRRYGHTHFHREYSNQMSLADFIDMFDARNIESYRKRQSDGKSYHPAVTGHGDPMDFWDQSSWKMIPQNDPSTDTPEVTTPSLIKHVNPNIKLILLLRDPVESYRQLIEYLVASNIQMVITAEGERICNTFQLLLASNKFYHLPTSSQHTIATSTHSIARLLFSNYLHAQFGTTATQFHDDVMASLSLLTSCTRNRTMKACLYDEDIIRNLQVPISGSFYSIHLQEWLKVFPRKQIYITRTEDFSKSVADTLLGIFRFLNIDPLPTRDLYRIANMPHYYDTKAKQTSGEILDETRAALRSLFQPYNDNLAKMLNDRKYDFSDTGR